MRQGEDVGRADESGAELQRDESPAEDRPRHERGPALVEQPTPAPPAADADDDQLLADLLGAARRAANGLSPGHPWKIAAREIAFELSETLDQRDSPPVQLVRPSGRSAFPRRAAEDSRPPAPGHPPE